MVLDNNNLVILCYLTGTGVIMHLPVKLLLTSKDDMGWKVAWLK